MELARLLGYIGDSVTFASGILLSWDAMRSESEFVEATKITEGLKDPLMKHLTVKLDKVVITDANGVERVFRRRASKKAIVGSILLAVGFLFLLSGRIVEPYHLSIHDYHIEAEGLRSGAAH
jgi:hypothetical protein